MTFNVNAPAANPVFYRTYSRQTPTGKESWLDVCKRCTEGLAQVGSFTEEEELLVYEQMRDLKSLPSGRWLWVGGTDWIDKPENFSGAYNCTSTDMVDLRAFPLQMGLLMMGSGTGAVIEPHLIKHLPKVKNQLRVTALDNAGEGSRSEDTKMMVLHDHVRILIGDSRQGWCDGVELLLDLFTAEHDWAGEVVVDLAHVRPAGTPIKGFGGVSNPIRLAETYRRVGAILEGAHGRQLTSVECCLLLDEVSLAVVAGNVRRSAGMRQFAADDGEAAVAKDNLWQQGADGKWRIDPKRDALRMANHTRVFHTKPSHDDVRASVIKQFQSGEGAIQYAPEAIARSNADLLTSESLRKSFIYIYESLGVEDAKRFLAHIDPAMDDKELTHRVGRYGLNPCGEILGKDFHCNLSEVHLNNLDPKDKAGQLRAFQAAALSACALLHHEFIEERYQYSREKDPIIGVSFTGLFDFFVKRFGYQWLEWWEAGRPYNAYYQDVEAPP
jgi:ribonucleotide reductase, class II